METLPSHDRLVLTPDEITMEQFLASIENNILSLSFDPTSAELSRNYPAAELWDEFQSEVHQRFQESGLDAPIAVIGYGSLVGGGGRMTVGDIPQDFIEIQGWKRDLSLANCWRTRQLIEGSNFSIGDRRNFDERGVMAVEYTGNESDVMTAVMMPKTLRDVSDLTRKFAFRESPYTLVPVGMRKIRLHGKELNVPAIILHPVSEIVAIQKFGLDVISDMCLYPEGEHVPFHDKRVQPSLTYTEQVLRGADESGMMDEFRKTTSVHNGMTLERWLETIAPGNNSKVRPHHSNFSESRDHLLRLGHFPKPPQTPREQLLAMAGMGTIVRSHESATGVEIGNQTLPRAA